MDNEIFSSTSNILYSRKMNVQMLEIVHCCTDNPLSKGELVFFNREPLGV